MRAPGNALAYTKGNEYRGVKPKPILPTLEQTAVLRRAARGHIICTLIEGEKTPVFSYEDGTPITISDESVLKMIRQRWLVPDKSTRLFGNGFAQRYDARKP